MQVAAISRIPTFLHLPVKFPASLAKQGCAVAGCATPWKNREASTSAASKTARPCSRKAGLCLTYLVQLLALEK